MILIDIVYLIITTLTDSQMKIASANRLLQARPTEMGLEVTDLLVTFGSRKLTWLMARAAANDSGYVIYPLE